MNHQLGAIRHKLLPCQGQKVRLHVRAERNRILDTHGVLEGLYGEVFTVYVQSEDYARRYCYSYHDILTRHVSVIPVNL